MRDLLLIIILIATPVCNALAQNPETPDTVKIIKNAEKILVSRDADTTLIEVESESEYGKEQFSYTVKVEDSLADDDDSSIEFEIPFGIGKDKTKHKKYSRLRTFVFFLGNPYIGQRFNYSDKGNVKNSLELGFRDIIGMGWNRGSHTPTFSIGVGIGSQWYRAQDGFAYSRDGSNLVLLPAGNDYYVKSTWLYVLNFQVPLLLTIPMGSGFKFTLGGIGCFNTYACAQTEFLKGATKIKTTYKGLQQRLFTTDLMCSLGVCDILGVYASWSPMTLFKSPYGPQFKSWSIGATFNF
ncbi:MAG: hypothetical protein K2K32_09660 [Muribaculaceae bacterium]|nr:hypothetical protein [Muribaculaceae bacterium]